MFIPAYPDLPRNLQAFLALIVHCEGTDDYISAGRSPYACTFGYRHWIEDFSVHPNLRPYSAAGAYQFTIRTWNDVSTKLQLGSFSAIDQDIAAIFLIRRRMAFNDVCDGNFSEAIRKCSWEWASLPPQRYPPQRVRSVPHCMDFLYRYLSFLP